MVDFKSQECREEFSDWPHGLLAIGTFGIKDTTTNGDKDIQQFVGEGEDRTQHDTCDKDSTSFVDDFQDFTREEIDKLQKELNKLLTRKSDSEKEKEKEVVVDFPLDRFLNCPSSLEIDRRLSTKVVDNQGDEEEDDIERTISVILDKCKDIRAKKKEKAIGKKSISFLLKKMFVCSSGFARQPSFKDPLGDSRMEKLLRTMMHKKLSPENVHRYINHKQQEGENEGQNGQKTMVDDEYCSKWVKTDSDFIVLEI
ncbi:Protein DEEPER ROOTING 1 [Linum grandiflorum]